MAKLKFPHAKDPTSELDYLIKWKKMLKGDPITASVWTVPAGLAELGDSFNNDVTTIWLSEGVSGESYTLTNTITTASGRVIERDVILKVKER